MTTYDFTVPTHAKVDKYGNVTITFNCQDRKLPAPNGKFWLPCENKCGRLVAVNANVVATICRICEKEYFCDCNTTDHEPQCLCRRSPNDDPLWGGKDGE